MTAHTAPAALFPRFQSPQHLMRTPWAAYVDAVWGLQSFQRSDWPLSFSGFTWFDTARLPAHVRGKLAGRAARRPRRCLDLFESVDPKYDDPSKRAPSLWVYAYPSQAPVGREKGHHAPPKGPMVPSPWPFGFGSGTRVPVQHQCCDKPRKGFWMYVAAGSGVYYDVGRTIAFRDHEDAMAHFGVRKDLNWYDPAVEQHLLRAASASYDSIQYTHHTEHGVYKHEIFDLAFSSPLRGFDGNGGDETHQHQVELERDACPTASNRDRFFGGWRGRLPCTCARNATQLVCDVRQAASMRVG